MPNSPLNTNSSSTAPSSSPADRKPPVYTSVDSSSSSSTFNPVTSSKLATRSHELPASRQRPAFKSHKSTPSAAEKALAAPPAQSRGFYSIAREKTSNVLTNLAVRSKNSTSSLRSRQQYQQPQPQAQHSAHVKQGSVSTSASSQIYSKTGKSSTQSSEETHSSSSSIDGSTIHPDLDTEENSSIVLQRVSTEKGVTAGRSSTDRRRLLDRSPSPNRRDLSTETLQANPNKMHQTSSRLLRMTEDERPYTRDFKDLFSTLMVSLPLTAHRVRFQKIDHTFTSEEAINNLGSLKFSQSNRMPDPKDPSRIVTTTTTTTFSMAKEMARSVCQRFMDARFIESADGKPPVAFPLKNAVWQMTPKGMNVLQRFCQRNGINQRHVLDVLDSPRNTMHLVIMERDFGSDKIDSDRATVEVIFRRFVGPDGPNLKASTAISDSDSVSDYGTGMIGVKMARERKVGDRTLTNTFTGKAAVDWLMDCCTTVDRRETREICELFVKHGLMYSVYDDKAYIHQNPSTGLFQPSRNSVYGVTEKGQRVAGWRGRDRTPDPDSIKEPSTVSTNSKVNGIKTDTSKTTPRDSNNNRLLVIVNDAALRLLFREYLRETHCEENLAFFTEVREFTKHYDISERANMFTRMDAIRESLAAAYGKTF